MTKDVLVRVKGTQYMDGESDSIEVITAGTCYEKNGKWYVMYEETAEGTSEVTKNTVKLMPDKVEVTKKGLLSAQMVYERGKQYMTNYVTPMGVFVMGITTHALKLEETENRLRAEIEYELEMNGQMVSRNVLELQADAKGKKSQ